MINASPWAQFPALPHGLPCLPPGVGGSSLPVPHTPHPILGTSGMKRMKGKEDKEEVLAWSPLLFPSHCPSPTGLNRPQLPSALVPYLGGGAGRGGAEDSEGHALGL